MFSKKFGLEVEQKELAQSLGVARYVDIMTITECLPLALKILSAYSRFGFGCTSVGEREPRRTFRRQGESPRASLLVSPCRDTLPTPSQLRLSLQSRSDL